MIKIVNSYKYRTIRFIEVYEYNNWKIKLYSISINNEFVSSENVNIAKLNLKKWLSQSKIYGLEVYNLATLIIHEGREGCFAIINWWIDENMLQNFVYLKRNNEQNFSLFSNNGMVTCVWEMAIWWHERNAWVKHILMKNNNPDIESYLSEQLNTKI